MHSGIRAGSNVQSVLSGSERRGRNAVRVVLARGVRLCRGQLR
jgi:hypothetical protein